MDHRKIQIIFATGNKGKIREIKEILARRPGIEVLSMREAGVEASPEENGADFEDNALIKAQAVYDLLQASARYMGYDTDYRLRMEHLLSELEGVPDEQRTARFVAAVAAILPDGSSHVVRGAMEGRIGHEIAGQNGFGYDPFFYLPEYGMTSAEISPEEKNRISHRGKALRSMLGELGLLAQD